MLTEVYFLTDKVVNVSGRDTLAFRGQTLEIEDNDALTFELEGLVVITNKNSSYEQPEDKPSVKVRTSKKRTTKKKKVKKSDTKNKTKNSSNDRTRKSRKSKKLSKT